MKHATPIALDALEVLLMRLRQIDGLTERKRGLPSEVVRVHALP